LLKKHEEILLLCSQIAAAGRPASALHKIATTHAIDEGDFSLPKACATLESLVERGLMEKRVLPDLSLRNGKQYRTFSITQKGELALKRSLQTTAKLLLLAKSGIDVGRAA
jgi:hypothetical protein